MHTIIRKLFAKYIYHIPFTKKAWYNFQAMIPSDTYNERSFIVIFNEQNKYIPCPPIGSNVVYKIHGVSYLYKIIGFENESPYKDWLYPDSDYINPIIEFMKKL